MFAQYSKTIETRGRGFSPLTSFVQECVKDAAVQRGLCTIFVHHTSASLILCENADPDVRRDLEAFFSRLIPEGDSLYAHCAEGPDDMPAHIRSVLTQTSINVPIENGRCALGIWQGIYLWEHRNKAHRRRISLTILGEN